MSTLLTVERARTVIDTDLSDAELAAIIADEEAEMVRKCGAHGDGTTAVVERHRGSGTEIFLNRRAASVSTVTELYPGSTPTTLTTEQYYFGATAVITRLPFGALWPAGYTITVTYVPEDDRALRRMVLIELVRLALSQTGYTQETETSASGSHSYTLGSGSWERARANQYARLRMVTV